MRSGFEHELFEWPFPDEETMRLSGNDVQRELTRALVQEWGRESGVAAFYNSDIFDTHPLVSSAASTVRSVSVHKIWTPISLQGDSDRKSTRLNSSHVRISYAVFCLK